METKEDFYKGIPEDDDLAMEIVFYLEEYKCKTLEELEKTGKLVEYVMAKKAAMLSQVMAMKERYPEDMPQRDSIIWEMVQSNHLPIPMDDDWDEEEADE